MNAPSTPWIMVGTGHRPDKLGAKTTPEYERVFARMHTVAIGWLSDNQHRIHYVISGMALGWDQALAQACVDIELPWKAYIPFQGQEARWPKAAQERYQILLGKAIDVVTVSEGGYAPWKMQRRNIAMVDASGPNGVILALWDGSVGGTSNCVTYAQARNKFVINLWSRYQGQP